ncbi:MAG: hypothetical protein JWQ72_3645 [Polaromonas sp.]|nr:hypothetical protein [Polaromonas sp.]
MTERPILFSAGMVGALLDGTEALARTSFMLEPQIYAGAAA